MARPKFGEKGHEGESMSAYGARVRAYNKAKTGEQRSERGQKPAEGATVREGPPPAAAPKRGPNENQADFHARYRRWQKRSAPRAHESPRAQGQRRALKKKAKPTPSPTPEEEKE